MVKKQNLKCCICVFYCGKRKKVFVKNELVIIFTTDGFSINTYEWQNFPSFTEYVIADEWQFLFQSKDIYDLWKDQSNLTLCVYFSLVTTRNLIHHEFECEYSGKKKREKIKNHFQDEAHRVWNFHDTSIN